MSNPLFNMLGNGGGNFGPFGNMANFMQQFNQFKQNFQGDPKAQVQQMLNSGQITQEQFNQMANMATQIQKYLK